MILTLAREHRRPSRAAVARAAEDSDAAKFSLPMERRYVGQVVIPGQYITRVELAG